MKLEMLVAILCIAAVNSHAFDIDAGRSFGLGGAVLLSRPSATDISLCPVADMQKGIYYVEAGYQRKFELSDLDRGFFAAAYRFRKASISLGFSHFGRSDYYIEQVVKFAAAYKLRMVRFFVSTSGKNIEIGDNERHLTLRSLSFGLGTGLHYERYHAGLVIGNLNQPKLAENMDGENIIYKLYAEIEGLSRFSMTGHVVLERYEKPIISVGQYFYLLNYNAVYWGISSNPLSYGGGLEVAYSGIRLIYAVSYHPVLGFTHNVTLGYARELFHD